MFLLPSLKLTARTWNTGVGRWVSFWEGLLPGAMLVFGSVSVSTSTCFFFRSFQSKTFTPLHFECTKRFWDFFISDVWISLQQNQVVVASIIYIIYIFIYLFIYLFTQNPGKWSNSTSRYFQNGATTNHAAICFGKVCLFPNRVSQLPESKIQGGPWIQL